MADLGSLMGLGAVGGLMKAMTPKIPAMPTITAPPPPMPVPDDNVIKKQAEMQQAKRVMLSGRQATQNPGQADKLG